MGVTYCFEQDMDEMQIVTTERTYEGVGNSSSVDSIAPNIRNSEQRHWLSNMEIGMSRCRERPADGMVSVETLFLACVPQKSSRLIQSVDFYFQDQSGERNSSSVLDNLTQDGHQMATVLPPPSKRQKLAADDEKRQREEADRIPEGLGSVRVQFVDQASGQSTGAPVSLPLSQANVKNLELLLNSLQGQV